MLKWLKRKKEIKKHDKSYLKQPITLSENKPLKQYEITIFYRNGTNHTIKIDMIDDEDLIDAVFNNRISRLTDGKLIYFNSNEILTFQAKECKK